MRTFSETDLVSQFGWDGDGGLGDQLIAAIISGKKTATCCPVALYSAEEAERIRWTRGQVVSVLDKDGLPRCEVQMIEVFETRWARPDLRLVAGEGFGSDVAAFQAAHARVWDDLLRKQGLALTSDTRLLAELFGLRRGVLRAGPPVIETLEEGDVLTARQLCNDPLHK